ncbi:ArsR family transcriptional regulator [Haloprofundus marisrubri]|uniref:ArsR family transcriptional regulator n=1 Tax=Haloprofundus marisrubri TaxID=1514971 RepID=A0A0W1RAY9_9EURY|nr:AsnC family transcriptional regulator [Haloprofundus marisrubri]KTG10287.1 ArsR family transcriptional regulator [Haloprofundus marisrubri]
MRTLDDTDRQILRLLLEDARRPYSDIADNVGLSAPAVSDRVERLREIGVIRRFTLDVNRSLLREGSPMLVELDVRPAAAESVAKALTALDRVDHVFRTADARVVFRAPIRDGDVTALLDGVVDLEDIRDIDANLVVDDEWTPGLGEAELALSCVECGNTVTSEGESARFDDELYHFCCDSCLSNFEARYERLQSGV